MSGRAVCLTHARARARAGPEAAAQGPGPYQRGVR